MSLIGGKTPRNIGNRAERLVAKYLDGQRVVGSGAYKFSNKNLLGDVDIQVDGRDYLKVEVKATGRSHETRGQYYVVTEKVLNQMEREAEQYQQLGCLWIHFKNSTPSADFVIFPLYHAIRLVADASLNLDIGFEKLVGTKSTKLYKNDLEKIFGFSGVDTITAVQYEVNEKPYVIVRGGDVLYALIKIREGQDAT